MSQAKWDEKFMLLQEFYVEHDRFPMQKDEYKGVKLGLWCANQRRDMVNGKCLPERYEKLYEIGFWQSNTHDTHWGRNFQLLQQFLSDFGHFPIEQDIYQGVRLGKWCANQKLHAKRPDYPKERLKKLTEIGFFDTTRTAKWEQHFAMLQQFIAEYGRLPKRNELFDGFNIGAWCTEQKRKAASDSYPLYRLEKLKEIGLLNDDFRTLTWDESYILLQEYVREFHKFPVAQEKYHEYNIGAWCESQKFLAKNKAYPAEKMRRLEEIGFFSTTMDAKWEHRYQLLQSFVAEHGRFPKQKEHYKGEKLGNWCTMQKHHCKKSTYPKVRKEKLKEIGLIHDYEYNRTETYDEHSVIGS